MIDKAVKQINPTTYEVEMPSGDKVEVGNKKAVDFKPHLKLNRWGGECFIKVGLPTTEKVTPMVESGRVKWRGQKVETHFYPLEPRNVAAKDKDGNDVSFPQNELGGFEFEIILKEKPVTNKIIFNIQTQGLRFSYQPPLTQQEIDNGSIGPENVVGSYAVYHATRTNIHASKADAEKYKTGKAFHIYRPHLVDALGAEAWADLNISNSVLTITIPQQFLDEAKYPVTIDPEFGYHSIGALWEDYANGGNRDRSGTAWVMPAGGGTGNTIYVYLKDDPLDTVGITAFEGINEKDSGGAGVHDEVDSGITGGVIPAEAGEWIGVALVGNALTGGVTYILNSQPVNIDLANDVYIAYDNDGVWSNYQPDASVPPDDPWFDAITGTKKYSIYVEYSPPAPPVGLESKSANMGSKMVAAGLI